MSFPFKREPIEDPTVNIDGDDRKMVPITELRKVRAEAAEHRRSLKEYKELVESQKEAARIAGLSELEKAKELLRKTEDDNAKLRDSMNRAQFESITTSLAATAGFKDPQDVIKFVDVTDVQDGNGDVDMEKIGAAIKKLSEDKPYMRSRSGLNIGGPKSPGSLPDNSDEGKFKPQFTDQDSIEKLKLQARVLMGRGRMVDAIKFYNKVWESQYGIKQR